MKKLTVKGFDKNTYRTPKYCFNWLHIKCGWIDLDGCADHLNALCSRYIGAPAPDDSGNISIAPDFLADDLLEKLLDEAAERCVSSLRIFVNPPYSDVTPFIQQAKRLRDAGHFVVMLLNNDKSTQWYQNHIQGVANEVIDIVGGRISFLHPITGEEIKGNSKGQMVVIFDPTMEDFVTRSVSLDFIKKCGGYDG